MKVLLSILFVFLSLAGYSQSILPLRADTVLVEKTNGNGELKIRNSTRDSLGVMVNIGGGRTKFMRFRAINDSQFVVPPNDTITIKGGAGSGGSSGPPGSDQQIIFNDGGSFGAQTGVTINKTQRKISADTVLVKSLRTDSAKFNPITAPPALNGMVVLGHSIVAGTGASVPDSDWVQRASRYYSLAVSYDGSLGGSGIWKAASNFNLNINPGHSYATFGMVSFNDARRGAFDPKTRRKQINGWNSIFANQYLAAFVPANDASVTRYGSGWNTGYTSSVVGGKTVNGGIFTTTLNDSAVWPFTGSRIVVGLMGADGTGGDFNYAKLYIYIDNVLTDSVDENNQWDGISDGVYDNRRGPMAWFKTNLSNGPHSIKLVQGQSGNNMVIDYFGTLVTPADGKPLIMVHDPYMDAAGYAMSPNLSSPAITNQYNATLDSLRNVYAGLGYAVYRTRTENVYDTLTGLGPDHIHPKDLGYGQIFTSIVSDVPAFGIPSTAGTIYYGTDGHFFGSKNGQLKQIAYSGEDSLFYILNQTAKTQTGGFHISGDGIVDGTFTNRGLLSGSAISRTNKPISLGFGVDGTTPFMAMYRSGNGSNNKLYDVILESSGALSHRLLNDADNSATTYMQVTRSGTTVSGISFNGQTNINGSAVITPGAATALTITPVGNQTQINIAGTVTGFLIPFNVAASASSGILASIQNTSTASGAYSRLTLTTAGSTSGNPTTSWRDDGAGQDYYLGLNVPTGNLKLNAGNFNEFSGGTSIWEIQRNGWFGLGRIPTSRLTVGGYVDIDSTDNGTGSDSLLTIVNRRVKKIAPSSLTVSPALTTNYIGVGSSNVLSGSSAYQYNGTSVLQENSGATLAVTNSASAGTTAGGIINIYTKNTPNATHQLGIINFGTRDGSTNDNITAWIQAIANTNFVAGSAEQTDLAFGTTATNAVAEIMRIKGNGRVGIGIQSPTASLDLRVGTTALAPLGLNISGAALLTSPLAGKVEVDANARLFWTIANGNGNRKQLVYTDSVGSITNGRIPVGNNGEYTSSEIFPIVSTVTATGGVTLALSAKMTTIPVDATSGNITLTITPVYSNQLINIKRLDNSGNTVTVQMVSGTIDGVATMTVNGQWTNKQIQWTGSTTYIL
jgi:hypothetical protein